MKAQCPQPPVAISFAFPGPADYPAGIIGNMSNLPAFRGGVALGPMLEDHFGIPVFINNDGDLFVYGEAIAGFLPYVNDLLEKAGSPKRYKNLFGVTLGTGFGGGIVRDGELLIGDNSVSGEAWLLRNKLDPSVNAEEGASIRAVRRVYAEIAGLTLDEAPEPKTIYEIGIGQAAGHRAAAVEAFRRLGEVAGDAIAQALTLIDGLAVVGGGISGAAGLFLPSLVECHERCLRQGQRAPAAARSLCIEHRRSGPARAIPQGPDANTGRARQHANRAVRSACSARPSAYRGWGRARPWPSALMRMPFGSWNRSGDGVSVGCRAAKGVRDKYSVASTQYSVLSTAYSPNSLPPPFNPPPSRHAPRCRRPGSPRH